MGRRHTDAPRTASQATPGVAYGPPLVEPEVPVQHVPTTAGTGGTGWRQPPAPPVDHVAPADDAPGFDARVDDAPGFDPRVDDAPGFDPRVDDAPPFDAGAPFVTPADDVSPAARPVSPASVATSTDDDLSHGASATDEPAEQLVTPAEAARVARLSDAVQVVDGHPRYHLDSCPHLVGRVPETLPVAEAAELGFTPCATCAPATALLADARPI
ncbi:hypothetical protein ACGFIW_22040 [Micromonospora sp. NPDC048935]|uniref:hypothetical protein n=1 Tax=Micromonospora sp. NPDC048935 TaxID=3364262 RepID=UPI00372395C6